MIKEFMIKRGGLRLAASLAYPQMAENVKIPLVILMHALMMDSHEMLFELITKSLMEKQIAVLRFDFMGHGRSQGKFEDMTVPKELEDAEAALAYAETLPWVAGISLLGHSQGGVVAGMTAGRFPEKICSLVLMAPAASLAEEAREGRLAGAHYDPERIPSYISCFGRRIKGDYARTAQTLPVYELSTKYNGPVCLIHGTADTVVSPDVSEKYHELYANSRLHLMRGVDHEFYRDMAGAAGLAVDFLCVHAGQEENRQPGYPASETVKQYKEREKSR